MRDRIEIADAETLFGRGNRAFHVSSAQEGCACCEVFDREGESATPVCAVIFWDAVGQYFVDLPKGELRAETVLKILRKTVDLVCVPLPGLPNIATAPNDAPKQ